MSSWRVRHPGIGVLAYGSEEEARVAAGTAGELLPPTSCDHRSPAVVHNARRQPVRLVCSCNTEWRVVPIDALVTLPLVDEVRRVTEEVAG
jgi:hypothetical protein